MKAFMRRSLAPLVRSCEAGSTAVMAALRITAIVVELSKLRDYCLAPSHPRGRHKARVFRSRLGLTATDAAWLQEKLSAAAIAGLDQLRSSQSDEYGDRYLLDVDVQFRGRAATVRCAWIVRPGEEVLRLTTCYVL